MWPPACGAPSPGCGPRPHESPLGWRHILARGSPWRAATRGGRFCSSHRFLRTPAFHIEAIARFVKTIPTGSMVAGSMASRYDQGLHRTLSTFCRRCAPMFHTRFRTGGLCLVAGLALLAASPVSAKEIKLARHPDYHNGKIVFSYLGDLWLVQEDGSHPQRLTSHSAREVHPRFSPDGKWIAFSSDRYGNYDVFVMPAEGGEAKRLTYHSAPDTVVGWSRDSKKVVFSSSRGRVY